MGLQGQKILGHKGGLIGNKSQIKPVRPELGLS
jgi:hypothetical protein